MRRVNGKELPDIILSEGDYRLLSNFLIENERGISGGALEEEISRAKVVPTPWLPKETVALNTRVTFQDLQNGTTRTITIVEPDHADVSSGHVSVLAPVGSALLGLRPEQEIDWQMPNGQPRKFKVVAVSKQIGLEGENLQAA